MLQEMKVENTVSEEGPDVTLIHLGSNQLQLHYWAHVRSCAKRQIWRYGV